MQREKHAYTVTETSGIRKALADRAEKADAELRDCRRHFTEVCTDLDSRLEQQKTLVETKLKQAHAFVTEACANVERASKAKDTEHDTRFAELSRTIAEAASEAVAAHQKLEEVIMGRDAAQHERVAAMAKAIAEAERRVAEQAKEQERVVRDALRDAATEAALKLEEFTHETATKLRELARKVAACESNAAEAGRDLERDISERMRLLAAEFPPLAAKHAAAVAEADRRAEGDRQDVLQRIQQVEATGADARRLLKDALEGKAAELRDRLEAADVAYHAALAAATAEQKDIVSATAQELEKKVSAAKEVAAEALAKVVKEARAELEEAVAPLLDHNEKEEIRRRDMEVSCCSTAAAGKLIVWAVGVVALACSLTVPTLLCNAGFRCSSVFDVSLLPVWVLSVSPLRECRGFVRLLPFCGITHPPPCCGRQTSRT